MSGHGTGREAHSDDLQRQAEPADLPVTGEGAPVSPHLRRVRSVLRFLRGPGIIVISVLFIGVIVIKAASGGERREADRFVAQDVVVITELVSPPAFAVGGSCTGACRAGTAKATVNRVRERYWYRLADGTHRSHVRR